MSAYGPMQAPAAGGTTVGAKYLNSGRAAQITYLEDVEPDMITDSFPFLNRPSEKPADCAQGCGNVCLAGACLLPL